MPLSAPDTRPCASTSSTKRSNSPNTSAPALNISGSNLVHHTFKPSGRSFHAASACSMVVVVRPAAPAIGLGNQSSLSTIHRAKSSTSGPTDACPCPPDRPSSATVSSSSHAHALLRWAHNSISQPTLLFTELQPSPSARRSCPRPVPMAPTDASSHLPLSLAVPARTCPAIDPSGRTVPAQTGTSAGIADG